MRYLIFIVILLCLTCLSCQAQNTVISSETIDVIEPYSDDIHACIDNSHDFDNADWPYVKFVNTELYYSSVGLLDIQDMILIEQSHSEISKHAINIIDLDIKAQIDNIDSAIKRIEMIKSHMSTKALKHVDRAVHCLNKTKLLLSKIASELPKY